MEINKENKIVVGAHYLIALISFGLIYWGIIQDHTSNIVLGIAGICISLYYLLPRIRNNNWKYTVSKILKWLAILFLMNQEILLTFLKFQ